MHPISFIKAHPVAVLTSMAAGMIVGPWVLSKVGGTTGISLNLPTVGNGGG